MIIIIIIVIVIICNRYIIIITQYRSFTRARVITHLVPAYRPALLDMIL